MEYIGMAFTGLVVGAIARFLLPGEQKMGWIMTAILGVAGSFLANYAGTALGWYKNGETASYIGSVVGAIVLLVIGLNGFALLHLAGDDGLGPWTDTAARLGVPLTVLDLSDRDERSRYGADLVLVRPDQYVAWRGAASDADPTAVLCTTTGRSPA